MFDKVQGQTAEIPRKTFSTWTTCDCERVQCQTFRVSLYGRYHTDMDTGNAAGMFTIGVTWGFRPRKELDEHHAAKIVDKPEEILDYCKSS